MLSHWLCLCLCLCLCLISRVLSFVRSSVFPSVRSFVRLLVRSFVRSLVRSFVCLVDTVRVLVVRVGVLVCLIDVRAALASS